MLFALASISAFGKVNDYVADRDVVSGKNAEIDVIDGTQPADTVLLLSVDGPYYDHGMRNDRPDPPYSYIRIPRTKKVEGTLIYKKGCIYTSDYQIIHFNEASLYFTSEQIKDYIKGHKRFNSSKNTIIFGTGLGAAGASSLLAANSFEEGDFWDNATLSACIMAVTVIPCSIIGVPMMVAGKARLKRLVREYNQAYLFGK